MGRELTPHKPKKRLTSSLLSRAYGAAFLLPFVCVIFDYLNNQIICIQKRRECRENSVLLHSKTDTEK
jgi:hypothetical protein